MDRKLKAVLYMPDGNRRYARENKLPFSEAYSVGARTLKLFSDFFIAKGRAEIFIFHAMSSYTHKRTDMTLEPIYDALTECFDELGEFFSAENIRFRAIDHSGAIPLSLKTAARRLEQFTLKGSSGEVVVLLGYSLEADLNSALANNPKDYNGLRKRLLFPDIDLVIRPKEMRLSSGPVYAMAQSQMITLNKLNPEVKEIDLLNIVEEFFQWRSNKERNNPFHRKKV